jgi:hypothetical protein
VRRKSERDSEGWLSFYDGVPVWQLSSFARPRKRSKPNLVINLKGCNGSGKSTVPIRLIDMDKQRVYVTTSKDDKKPVATYLPQSRLIIFGMYLSKCGGCDALAGPWKVQELLKDFWTKDVHILFEGVIVGDIKSTFYDLMKAFCAIRPRECHFCFMGTKFKECLRRIQVRNGGRDINEDMVKAKYQNSLKQLIYYADQGDVGVQVLNTNGNISQIVERFLSMYPDMGPVF